MTGICLVSSNMYLLTLVLWIIVTCSFILFPCLYDRAFPVLNQGIGSVKMAMCHVPENAAEKQHMTAFQMRPERLRGKGEAQYAGIDHRRYCGFPL